VLEYTLASVVGDQELQPWVVSSVVHVKVKV